MKSDFDVGEPWPGVRDGVDVSPAEAMAELQRVLDSPDFVSSPRNRAFLQLVVEGTLRGRRVTGYDVAVEAFRRPPTFDAAKDPIVRIECSKLRKALEIYYLKSGRRNPLRLDLPKGRYRAVFRPNGKHDDEAGPLPAWLDAKSAALLRAAIAGWAGESIDGSRAWRELQEMFAGFSPRGSVQDFLASIRCQYPELHGLLEEGLRRLGRRAALFTAATPPAE